MFELPPGSLTAVFQTWLTGTCAPLLQSRLFEDQSGSPC